MTQKEASGQIPYLRLFASFSLPCHLDICESYVSLPIRVHDHSFQNICEMDDWVLSGCQIVDAELNIPASVERKTHINLHAHTLYLLYHSLSWGFTSAGYLVDSVPYLRPPRTIMSIDGGSTSYGYKIILSTCLVINIFLVLGTYSRLRDAWRPIEYSENTHYLLVAARWQFNYSIPRQGQSPCLPCSYGTPSRRNDFPRIHKIRIRSFP